MSKISEVDMEGLTYICFLRLLEKTKRRKDKSFKMEVTTQSLKYVALFVLSLDNSYESK